MGQSRPVIGLSAGFESVLDQIASVHITTVGSFPVSTRARTVRRVTPRHPSRPTVQMRNIVKLLRAALLAFLLVIAVAGCGSDTSSSPGKILLVPIGAVPHDVLGHLQRELTPIMNREVVIAAEIPRPQQAFDGSRQQYRGGSLLEELKRHDLASAERVLGIIDADTYAPGLNFIFGQATKPGRFAVIALPRLRESFRGRPDDLQRFHERAVKEAIHELGHTFDLAHCPDSKCVMHFSNSFGDTDRKTKHFCAREKRRD